jgi:hypothetical protein
MKQGLAIPEVGVDIDSVRNADFPTLVGPLV